MALDTKYRPNTYDGVLGQSSTVQILRQYVKSGSGFHQSYLFAGPWGSGKTTLGRILARSLLCEAPVDGAACDACTSCRSILIGGTSENFVEIDAATNSGKDSIRKIVEEISYSTFSGKQRIYLFDESHRLSTDALDALLKPLEDCVPGSEDKSLVCIFCTTEPERMRSTLLSRCAPAFIIKPVTPIQIGERLSVVCDSESISYDREALNLIGELTECHIRDALKAVEGVSMLGSVTRENVAKYLHLDSHILVLDILSSILGDLPKALSVASGLLQTTSPTTLYEKLSEMAMLAYRVKLGVAKAPSYLDPSRLQSVGETVGDKLLTYATRFASRPSRPSSSMVLCDIAQLHQDAVAPPIQTVVSVIQSPVSFPEKPPELGTVKEEAPKMVDNVYVHPRAVRSVVASSPRESSSPTSHELQPLQFCSLVKLRVSELLESERLDGRKGQNDMDSSGVVQSG